MCVGGIARLRKSVCVREIVRLGKCVGGVVRLGMCVCGRNSEAKKVCVCEE